MSPMGEMTIDLTRGFEGDTLGVIDFDAARHRILTFCTSPVGAWVTYDLAAAQSRTAGLFDHVEPWSIMWADALAGQVSLRNIADFTLERREEFAQLVRRVPEQQDLVSMDDAGRADVVNLCCFGYQGVWGPKVTKAAALYRPRSVPVLDGAIAYAFGYSREAFSMGGGLRRTRVARIVDTLGDWLQENQDVIDALRSEIRPVVPEVGLTSDVRLLTIIIWTSQDDRLARTRKPRDSWLNGIVGQRIPLDSQKHVPLRVAG